MAHQSQKDKQLERIIQSQIEVMNQLKKSVDNLNDTNGNFLSFQKDNKKERQDRQKKEERSIQGLLRTNLLLVGSIGGLITMGKSFLNRIDSLALQTARLGLTLGQARDAFGEIDLPGLDLFQGLQVAIKAQQVGLNANNKELLKLAGQQKLMTGSSDALLGSLSEFKGALALTSDGVGDLAKMLRQTSERGNVTTEKLIGVMQSLIDVTQSVTLLGAGENLNAAIAQLTTEFPNSVQQIMQTVRFATDDSIEGMNKASIANVKRFRDILATNAPVADIVASLKGVALGLSDRAEISAAQARASSDAFVSFRMIFKNLLGEQAVGVATFGNTIKNNEKRLTILGDRTKAAGESMTALKNSFNKGFQKQAESIIKMETLTKVMGGLQGVTQTLANATTALVVAQSLKSAGTIWGIVSTIGKSMGPIGLGITAIAGIAAVIALNTGTTAKVSKAQLGQLKRDEVKTAKGLVQTTATLVQKRDIDLINTMVAASRTQGASFRDDQIDALTTILQQIVDNTSRANTISTQKKTRLGVITSGGN